MASIATESADYGTPAPAPAVILAGGETTVTLKGKGKGGRNQELVLSALKIIGDRKGIAILSGGTDGIDGNSPYAGAVCDSQTFKNAHKLNLDIDKFIENNDSSTFFERTGGVIETGKTGTNVMDILIMVVGAVR
ncbi:MOFRL family protein [Desulfurobacterium atlanticum]|uniref:MOFRL family protein n=2 Tax=Desulfurobacterium atlanticum TaxID=240169 RepID=A0A239A6U9_9BACT|nr:MOFRL family protein [Desulfurobacterium atlanticum]